MHEVTDLKSAITQSRIKKTSSRCILIKTDKNKEKETILKAVREKRCITLQGVAIRLALTSQQKQCEHNGTISSKCWRN